MIVGWPKIHGFVIRWSFSDFDKSSMAKNRLFPLYYHKSLVCTGACSNKPMSNNTEVMWRQPGVFSVTIEAFLGVGLPVSILAPAESTGYDPPFHQPLQHLLLLRSTSSFFQVFCPSLKWFYVVCFCQVFCVQTLQVRYFPTTQNSELSQTPAGSGPSINRI